jgi:hypothetical protein
MEMAQDLKRISISRGSSYIQFAFTFSHATGRSLVEDGSAKICREKCRNVEECQSQSTLLGLPPNTNPQAGGGK